MLQCIQAAVLDFYKWINTKLTSYKTVLNLFNHNKLCITYKLYEGYHTKTSVSNLQKNDITKMASIIRVLCFVFARTIFNVFQGMYWLVTGTALKIWQCHNNSFVFEQSAQLLDVKYHCTEFQGDAAPSRSHFIVTHNGFVSPKYIRRPGVALYCFEERKVVFVEWTSTSTDSSFYNSSCSGWFLKTPHSRRRRRSLPKYGERRAERMIVMSIEAYHEAEDNWDDHSQSSVKIRQVINTSHKCYREDSKLTHLFSSFRFSKDKNASNMTLPYLSKGNQESRMSSLSTLLSSWTLLTIKLYPLLKTYWVEDM